MGGKAVSLRKIAKRGRYRVLFLLITIQMLFLWWILLLLTSKPRIEPKEDED
jgi:hypothetical protein